MQSFRGGDFRIHICPAPEVQVTAVVYILCVADRSIPCLIDSIDSQFQTERQFCLDHFLITVDSIEMSQDEPVPLAKLNEAVDYVEAEYGCKRAYAIAFVLEEGIKRLGIGTAE